MIKLIIPTAIAASISDAGRGMGGLTTMWSEIQVYMAYAGNSSGILVMTGIVINAVLWMIGSAAILVILYASIRLIASGGNDETVRKAWKEMIFYACLGLVFAILSETILKYVINLVSVIASG